MITEEFQNRDPDTPFWLQPRLILALLKETYAEWNLDRVPRLGAALAFYTAFSLAPLLIIAIGLAGLVFGREAAQGQIQAQIGGLVGDSGAELVQTMIEQASQPREGLIASAIGVVTLVFGALGAFGQLQDALNTIWEVRPKPGRGWRGLLKDRFTSSILVIGVGFLLLASLVVSAGLTALSTFLGGYLSDSTQLVEVLNFVFSLAVVTLLFALMFRVLPDAQIAWSDVWIGAALTSLLFNLGKYAIGLYLGSGGVGTAYGAAGSLVILLLWLYYSAQILFLGAEFTQVYANRYGSKIRPSANAVPVTEEMRAHEGIPHTEPEPTPTPAPAPAPKPPAAMHANAAHANRVPPALLDLFEEPADKLAHSGVPPALREFFEEPPARNPWPAYAGLALCFVLGAGAGALLTLRALRANQRPSD